MKLVKITNATVRPFYRPQNSDAPIEIVRVAPKKEGSSYQMVTFNIETKADDHPDRNAKLFEKCTFFAKTDSEVTAMQNTLLDGVLIEIEGKEKRFKGNKPDANGKDVYYNNVVVDKVTPLSTGVNDGSVNPDEAGNDDDLPF
jgi:hypothetical protein